LGEKAGKDDDGEHSIEFLAAGARVNGKFLLASGGKYGGDA